MLVFRAGIHKFLLQKQSDLGLPCLSRPFWQAISVQNFTIFTEYLSRKRYVVGTHNIMFCRGEILKKNIVFLLQKQLSRAFVNVPCYGKVDFIVSEEDLG